MKNLFFLFFLFPLFIFGAQNLAIHTIQNITPDKSDGLITFEDGSVWKGRYFYEIWNEGDLVIITYDNEYGFIARNLDVNYASLSVELVVSPESHVIAVEDTYFVLSNGITLERKPYMYLDIGDRVFLCGYSIGLEAEYGIVYNVSKPWIGGRTKVLNIDR